MGRNMSRKSPVGGVNGDNYVFHASPYFFTFAVMTATGNKDPKISQMATMIMGEQRSGNTIGKSAYQSGEGWGFTRPHA